jgi:hypothetical protein
MLKFTGVEYDLLISPVNYIIYYTGYDVLHIHYPNNIFYMSSINIR